MKEIPTLTVEQQATVVLELRDVADKIESGEIGVVGFRSGEKTIRQVGKHKAIRGLWGFEIVYRPSEVKGPLCDEGKEGNDTSKESGQSAETTNVPPAN